MTIGEKIRELRKQNNITQEALAEALSISFQSISKWENNAAMPDISLVVPLANFFNVTIDELFDRNRERCEQDIADYLQKEHTLSHAGLIDDRIALWRNAVRKYPNHHKCIQMLANALWRSRNSKTLSYEQKVQNLQESITLNERLFHDCNDLAIRFSALQLLVFSYSDTHYPFADEEKALCYANQAPIFYCSWNTFLERAYFSDENRAKAVQIKHQNILSFIDCATHRIRDNDLETPEERILAYESALKIWDALIYDGNYEFYHCRIAELYDALAKNFALLQKREKTLEALRQAKFHADRYDNLPGGVRNYTSILVSAAISDCSRSTKNHTETQAQLLLHGLSDVCFDFLREDEEFKNFCESFLQ